MAGVDAVQQLLRQEREQRMRWVDLESAGDGVSGTPGTPAKRVRIIRPTEVEISRHLVKASGHLGVDFEDLCRFTVDWSGFTSADLIGGALGSSDPLPFSAELWAALVADRHQWLGKASRALLDVVVAHAEQLETDRKN